MGTWLKPDGTPGGHWPTSMIEEDALLVGLKYPKVMEALKKAETAPPGERSRRLNELHAETVAALKVERSLPKAEQGVIRF